jgi:hypothetical protein
VQGIFSRRLRKRIDANTQTNGQTNGRTNSQAEYNAVPNMARAPQCSVLNIILLVHVDGNAESFICRRAPHFSTVSGSLVGRQLVRTLGSKGCVLKPSK